MLFKNKVVLPPMATEKSLDGKATQSLVDYYEKMAKCGFGTIILEHAYVNIIGKASKNQMAIDETYSKDILTKISNMIHEYDVNAIMQISHAGEKAVKQEGLKRVSPSGGEDASELTVDEIKALELDFLNAAKRVKEMGYDGVELHSAHGYLFNQFYSPITNKRTDEYGGSVENRLRFLCETISLIKEELPDYPILVRLGAMDYVEGGNGEDEALEAAEILEKVGISILDISGGITGFLKHPEVDFGYFKDICKKIKGKISIPVITTGGVKNLKEVNALIDGGYADFVGVGRKSLNNPNWMNEM